MELEVKEEKQVTKNEIQKKKTRIRFTILFGIFLSTLGLYVLFYKPLQEQIIQWSQLRFLKQNLLTKDYRLGLTILGEATPQVREMLLPFLIESLNDKNSDVKIRALNAIAEIGPILPSLIVAVQNTLYDSDFYVAKQSAILFEEWVFKYKETISPFLEALEKILHDRIRFEAAEVLSRLGKIEVIPTLLESSVSTVPSSIYIPRQGLTRFGDRVLLQAFLAALTHKNEDIRRGAVIALKKFPMDIVVEKLILQLKDSSPKVRQEVCLTLGLIRGERKEAIPPLIAVLKDNDAKVRKEAAVALGVYLVHRELSISALLPLLKDKDNEVKAAAILSLGRLKAKVVIPDLKKAILSEDEDVATAAALALLDLGLQEPQTLAILLKSKKNTELKTKYRTQKEDLIFLIRSMSDPVIDLEVTLLLFFNPKYLKEAIPLFTNHFFKINIIFQVQILKELIKLPNEIIVELNPFITQLLEKESNNTLLVQTLNLLDKLEAKQIKEFIPMLCKIFPKAYADARLKILQQIVKIDEKRDLVIPLLEEALKEPSPKVRHLAIYQAGRIGERGKKLIPIIIESLIKNESDALKYNAGLYTLRKIAGDSSDSGLIHFFVRSLDHGAREIRVEAKKQLLIIGNAQKKLIPLYLQILQEEKSSKIRGEMVLILGEIKCQEAIPLLMQFISTEDGILCRNAILALGLIGPPAKEAENVLLRITQQDDEILQEYAVQALVQIKIDSEKAIETLRPLLKSSIPEIKSKVILFFGNLAGKSRSTIPDLLRILKGGRTFELKLQAAWALIEIDSSLLEPLPFLLKGLQESIDEVKIKILDLIGRNKLKPEGLVKELLRQLKGGAFPDLKEKIIWSFGQLGKDAVLALPFLFQEIKKGPWWSVNLTAQQAIVKIGQEDPKALEALLLRDLKHKDWKIRSRMFGLIEQAQLRTPKIEKTLIKTLEDPYPLARKQAAITLGSLSLKTSEVENALEKATKDREFMVSDAAKKSLAKIRKESKE